MHSLSSFTVYASCLITYPRLKLRATALFEKMGDKRTGGRADGQTDRQMHKLTTITLAAHARARVINNANRDASMNDSQSVEVLDSQSYLCSIEPGVILGKNPLLLKMEL